MGIIDMLFRLCTTLRKFLLSLASLVTKREYDGFVITIYICNEIFPTKMCGHLYCLDKKPYQKAFQESFQYFYDVFYNTAFGVAKIPSRVDDSFLFDDSTEDALILLTERKHYGANSMFEM